MSYQGTCNGVFTLLNGTTTTLFTAVANSGNYINGYSIDNSLSTAGTAGLVGVLTDAQISTDGNQFPLLGGARANFRGKLTKIVVVNNTGGTITICAGITEDGAF
jgi:hypothetical protein